MTKDRSGCRPFAEKEGYKSEMKERVGDEKLIKISVAVRGINDHIRFYSSQVALFAPHLTHCSLGPRRLAINRRR